MARISQPTRLLRVNYESVVGGDAASFRTVPQQIAHWARNGRGLEASPQMNHRQVAEVLSGSGSYDSLTEQEQAIVRAGWGDRMNALREELDYAARFIASGESYSELDEDGNLVIHPARA